MDEIALQDQVGRIVEGETFAQKAQLKSLLKILADHYQSQAALKPARVIQELWPGDQSRESRDLAAAMYRLRHALAEYYTGEGTSDSIVISLPRRAGEAAGEGGSRHWISAEAREHPKTSVGLCDAPTIMPPDVRPEFFQAASDPTSAFSPGPAASVRVRPRVRRLIAAFSGVVIFLAAFPYLLRDIQRDFHVKPTPIATAAGDPRPSPGAEQLYLRGRYLWNLRTADSLAKALDAYTQAIVIDPSYANAYAGLAETYDLLPQFGKADLGDSLTKAMNAADRAIALNPDFADAHQAKAFAMFYWNWDITGSDAEFRRAIALDPNSAQAHHWYASTLADRLESAECLKQIDEALRLNPTSAAIAADAAVFQADFRNFDGGVKALKEIEQTQPTLATPSNFLANLYFAKGDYPGYIAELSRYASITQNADDLALVDTVARGWAEGGKIGLLNAKAKYLKASFERGQETGFWLGQTLVQLGRPKDALPYFQASLKRRHIWLISMQQCAWARKLDRDPGYAVLFSEIREQVNGDLAAHPSVAVSSELPQ